MTAVKNGIRDEVALTAATNAGARSGFCLLSDLRTFEAAQAANLARQTPLTTVGLFVDPDDETCAVFSPKCLSK